MPDVTFLPIEADYLAASRANYLAEVRSWRGGGRIVGVVLGVGLAVGVLFWWIEGEIGPSMLYVLVGYAALAIACVALNWFLLARRVRRMFTDQPGFLEPMSVAWTNEGITIDSPMTTHRLAWGRLTRWRDEKAAVLLYLTGSVCVFVPKRALSTSQLTDLLTQLRTGVPGR